MDSEHNEEVKDLMKIIQIKYPRLSKSQKLIAEYILSSYDKAAFMTAAKLGVSVGVSESTVVRFANEVGFEGYPKLQKALQELIKNRLTTVQRLELSNDYLSNELVLDASNRRTIGTKNPRPEDSPQSSRHFKGSILYKDLF